jgi:hypothetical protein
VAGWATLFLKEEARLGKVRFTVSGRAEEITSNERGPLIFDPADRGLRRSPLSIREAFVRAPVLPSLDVVAGRFELGWGKTDGYSPADAFLPRDLSDPYADEKLPLWGVRFLGQEGPVRVDGLWCVTTTPWRLPVLIGRNAPLQAPEGIPAYLVDGESHAPREGFGAVRLLGTFGDWDVGAWARGGVRPAPLLVLRLDEVFLTSRGFAVPADRRFARETAGGVEVSRVVGAFVARAEAAYLSSGDAELGDAIIWTVGLERSIGDGTFLVTFAANAKATPVDPALLFDRAFLPGLIATYSRTERWGSWRAVWITAFKHGDGLVKGEVAYNVTDVWSATAGIDVPYGSGFGPFGARDATRRARLAVRRSW